MTEEGRRGDPIDEVELLNSVRSVAATTRMMYEELRNQEFTEREALTLTGQWLRASTAGSPE